MLNIFKSKKRKAAERRDAFLKFVAADRAQRLSQRLSENDTSVLHAFQAHCRKHGINEKEA